MNIAKVLEALNKTDQLACGILVSTQQKARCAIGQLFYAAGKSDEEIIKEECLEPDYNKMFNCLLVKEYGISIQNVDIIHTNNDHNYNKAIYRRARSESTKLRHKRVMNYWEGELIECLISDSSSPVEEDLKVCEDVSIAPLHMQEMISV